jgi:uncharacterized repeat protein (TIGR01451 family)
MAPVASAQGSKEEMHSEMLGIAQQMWALKPLLDVSPQAAAEYAALEARYRAISDAMGGDDPARALGDSPSPGQATPAGRAARVAPGPPPACNTALTTVTNNTPVPIPGGPAVVTSTLVVSGAGTYIHDVDLTTFITHTFASDLDITLLSPGGTVVTLTTDNGGGNDNVFNGTIWDDDADPDGQVPYTSNDGLVTDSTYANNVLESPLVPEEAMGAFIGEDPNGTWTITISDDLGGDSGSLNSWTLDATTCLCGAPNLIFNPDPKTVDNPGPVLSGDFLTYTITVQNIGNAAATNVVVMDPIPAMTTYVSDDCGGANVPPWTWNIGNLAASASVTCNLTVQVDPPPLPPGQICNQGYTVDSDQTAPFTGQPQCVDLVPVDLMEFETAAGDK